MRLHRFYVNQPLATGKTIRITDEALVHQWRRVFRFTTGQDVILFDGSGFDYHASIADFGKDTADVLIGERKLGINPAREVWLFVSIIKKDKFEWVVEKATEIGVSHIVPILSDRTEKKSLNMERLSIISKEASEQSGRTNIPTIHEQVDLAGAFSLITDESGLASDSIYVCDMGGEGVGALSGNGAKNPVAIFVGPEGGWSDLDREFFAGKNVKTVSLGATVLRAETAAVVGCAAACLV